MKQHSSRNMILLLSNGICLCHLHHHHHHRIDDAIYYCSQLPDDSTVNMLKCADLNINVTKSLYDSFMGEEKEKEKEKKNDEKEKEKEKEKELLTEELLDDIGAESFFVKDNSSAIEILICNHTGVRLWYWMGDRSPSSLVSGESREEVIGTLIQKAGGDVRETYNQLSVQLQGGWDPIVNLPTTRTMSIVIPLTPCPVNDKISLCYNVEFENGLKRVILRSNVLMTNYTSLPLVCRMNSPSSSSVSAERVVHPNESYYVPISVAANGVFFFRAEKKDDNASASLLTSWNDRPLRCDSLIEGIEVTTTSHPMGNARSALQDEFEASGSSKTLVPSRVAMSRSSSFYMQTNVFKAQEDSLPDYQISISPPFMFVNLLACPAEITILEQGKDGSQAVRDFARIDIGGTWSTYCCARNNKALMVSVIAEPHWKMAEPKKLSLAGDKIDFTLVNSQNSSKKKGQQLNVMFDIHKNDSRGQVTLALQAKYWVLNCTGLPLRMRHGHDSDTIAASEVLETSGDSITADPDEFYSALSAISDSPTKKEDMRALHERFKLFQPIMYSYRSNDLFGNKTSFSIGNNSKWSKPISLESPGTSGDLQLPSDDSSVLYSLGISVQLGPGRFRKTKVVTVAPRFVLLNKSSMCVYYTQEQSMQEKGDGEYTGRPGQSSAHLEDFTVDNSGDKRTIGSNTMTDLSYASVDTGRAVPLHWPKRRKQKLLRLCFGLNWTWSGAITIGEVDDIAVCMCYKGGAAEIWRMLGVEVQHKGATFWVRFYDVSAEQSPYRIENCTAETLNIFQKSIDEKVSRKDFSSNHHVHVLDPSTTLLYTWEEPTLPHRLVVGITNSKCKRDFSLDKISEKVWKTDIECLDIRANTKYFMTIKVSVFADGSTRVLRLTEIAPKLKNTKEDENVADAGPSKIGKAKGVINHLPWKGKGNVKSHAETFNTERGAQVGQSQLYCIKKIGISFINETPQEFMYMQFDNLRLEMNSNNVDYFYELIIEDLQIDNQLYGAYLPVVLSREADEQNVDVIHMSVTQALQQAAGVDRFRYFSFLLQEMDISVDEEFVNELLYFTNMYTDNNVENMADSLHTHEKSDYLDLVKDEILPPERSRDFRYLYIDAFHLNPIKLNFSFVPSVVPDQEAPLRQLVGAIGVGVATIDRAPIKLNSLYIESLYCTRRDFYDRLSRHYIQQGIRQIYKVLGSIDALGNPVSLVSNLGTGVKDFFYEPAQGLVKSPKDFGKGVAKGSKSLVKHSVTGLFTTFSKLSGTVSKGVASLSLDEHYMQEREEASRQQPRHVGEGLVFGLKELGMGVVKGATGVVMNPVRGAKENGMKGFAKGVGTGLIGVAVKPGVGLFDLATRTTQGIMNTATYFDDKAHRIREPRYIGQDGRVVLYDQASAYAQSLLAVLEEGKYKQEWYLFNVPLQNRTLLLVTNISVFLISFASSKAQLEWRVMIKSMSSVNYLSSCILNVPRSILNPNLILQGSRSWSGLPKPTSSFTTTARMGRAPPSPSCRMIRS